jgi:hypothetical protein
VSIDDEIEEAFESADEARRRAEEAARREEATRGGIGEEYGGDPPEHVPEEIDQPPRP